MPQILDLLGGGMMIVGACFAIIGGIGLIRLPDLFSRMHGSGITDTLGAILILGGLAIQSGLSLVTIKLVLLVGFLLLSSPTSTHALAKSALAHGVVPLGCEKDPPSSR